jgi:putative transposase
MTQVHSNQIDALMELMIQHGPDSMAEAFRRLLNLAMRVEREQYLGASEYERTPSRRGFGNGFKSKSLDTPAGTITIDVPKTRQHDGEPFFPQSLERGTRSNRAVMACIAEMYVKGVSTRDVQNVMAELGLENVSSTQVSRANALLDEELTAWRERPLGEVRYLVVDARYEKVRQAGVVVDTAVL